MRSLQVEYAVNDRRPGRDSPLDIERGGFERLLRKLLDFPQRPAAVLVMIYEWYSRPLVSRAPTLVLSSLFMLHQEPFPDTLHPTTAH